ncbi:unnamed protein product, partial [Ectocarpus sp. 12 AP-2014]
MPRLHICRQQHRSTKVLGCQVESPRSHRKKKSFPFRLSYVDTQAKSQGQSRLNYYSRSTSTRGEVQQKPWKMGICAKRQKRNEMDDTSHRCKHRLHVSRFFLALIGEIALKFFFTCTS